MPWKKRDKKIILPRNSERRIRAKDIEAMFAARLEELRKEKRYRSMP